jgi:hypothetical protein
LLNFYGSNFYKVVHAKLEKGDINISFSEAINLKALLASTSGSLFEIAINILRTFSPPAGIFFT